MTQHTPARYPNRRTVPQGWSDDIGLAAAFMLLLLVPAVIVAGAVGVIGALVVGLALARLSSRLFVSPS